MPAYIWEAYIENGKKKGSQWMCKVNSLTLID